MVVPFLPPSAGNQLIDIFYRKKIKIKGESSAGESSAGESELKL